LIPNQIRALTPERNTAYKNGGVLANRMTLREGPQALDAQRLGRAAEALHLALLQSAPPGPGEDSVICLFAACPKEWSARFTLLARGVSSSRRRSRRARSIPSSCFRKVAPPAGCAIRGLGRLSKFYATAVEPKA
jgi:hypothetical protein